MTKDQSVNLGRLQGEFELARKEYHAAEKALARANEARNSAKRKFESTDASLRAAAQAVLG